MIIEYPTYYKEFNCIASKCKSSCCSAGWEILIDKETSEFYKSIPGEFGDKLRSNIDFSNQVKFKLESNGRCPFLNDENLCDIYINLGQEHLCQICTDHPRFYECFKDRIECGLGVYCEEACRIILSQDKKFTTYTEKTSEKFDCDYNEKIYKYIRGNRAKIIDYLSNESINLNQRIADVLWFAHTLQQNIDSSMLDDEDIFKVTSVETKKIEPIFNYLLKLEQNDQNWFNYLTESLEIYKNNIEKFIAFEKENPQIQKYLKNLSIYYIYRYFLRGIYSEDIISPVKFMAISIAVVKILLFSKWIKQGFINFSDCIYVIKKYAEEIECNDDNILNFHIACYEIEAFNIENLLSLFI